MDLALTLDYLVPQAKFRGSLTANTQEAFDAIVWEDERQKPAWEDILATFETASSYYLNKQRIQELEAEITPRRIREAILTAEGKAWLDAKEAEISALR